MNKSFFKQLLLLSGVWVWGALGTLLALISLSVYVSSLQHRAASLDRQLTNLHHLSVRSKEAIAYIQTHSKDFADFTACRFGESLAPTDLKKKDLPSIEFGACTSLEDGIVSQDVSLHLSCLQDQEIFRVLDQMVRKGPGIFHIKEVIIRRLGPLSEQMLEEIAEGKPSPLVDGRIVATWIHQ